MDIKISELSSINQSDLEPDDIFLVVRGGQWTKTISASQLYRLSTDNITDGILDVQYGGVGTDLSQTGGTKHYVKQLATGAGLTTGLIQADDIPTSLPLINIGGTHSMSVGSSSPQILIGNDLADDYIYGHTIELNSDSIALYSGNTQIRIANDSDVLITGNTQITGQFAVSGNVTVNNLLGNSASLSGALSCNSASLSGALSCNSASLSGALSCNSASLSGALSCNSASLNSLTMPQLINNRVIYGNDGQLNVFNGVSNTVIGYSSDNNLRSYNGSELASLLGTNSIDGIAKTTIMVSGSNIGAEKTINFIPSGLTMTGVDSGTQVDLTLSVAAGDNTASKIYLWSNYR